MRITIYPHSILASLLSIIGTMFAALGILLAIVNLSVEAILAGVIMFAMGLGCTAGAEHIGENKKFDDWRKRVRNAGLEPIIQQSVEDAVKIYQTYPSKHTLGYISALNPEAGRLITAYIQNNAKSQ
ncbi:hypothetical protein [Butyricicoccus sp.]|uniref:hypothetical protein n=1 Tax=Butyricicoccus sp. TaxID=2049021 RepID=UPI003F14866B